MKFVLKVFVLVCLIVISKLAKNEAVTLQNPVAGIKEAHQSDAILPADNALPAIAEKQGTPVFVKFEKTALQFN